MGSGWTDFIILICLVFPETLEHIVSTKHSNMVNKPASKSISIRSESKGVKCIKMFANLDLHLGVSTGVAVYGSELAE